jgi:hypothetical protein
MLVSMPAQLFELTMGRIVSACTVKPRDECAQSRAQAAMRQVTTLSGKRAELVSRYWQDIEVAVDIQRDREVMRGVCVT